LGRRRSRWRQATGFVVVVVAAVVVVVVVDVWKLEEAERKGEEEDGEGERLSKEARVVRERRTGLKRSRSVRSGEEMSCMSGKARRGSSSSSTCGLPPHNAQLLATPSTRKSSPRWPTWKPPLL